MELSEILRPAAVKVVANASSKKRLFQDLGDLVSATYGIDSATAFTALQERETLGPTGVGHGIALPHAKIAGLDHVVGVFLRLEKPVDFDSVDRQPVDLVFALFAPDSGGVEHLKALALVSRTMRDAAVAAKLRANSDSETLHTILTEAQTTRAA